MNKWVDEDTLYDICGDLVIAGYDYRFTEATKLAALQFEGVYDLLLMWVVEKNPKERRKIIADIVELLTDIRRGYEIQASKKEQEAEKSNTSQQTDK